MKRLLILSLVMAGCVLPAAAQRGGGARGGFGGGMRGGFSGGGAGFRSSGAMSVGRGFALGGAARGYAPSFRTARPMYGARPGYAARPAYVGHPGYNYAARRAPYPVRRPVHASSYGYPGPAWYVPNYLSYPYADYDDDDDSVYGAPQDNYVASAAEPEPRDAEQPYQQPYPSAANGPSVARANPEPDDAVTLVFKDGRPNEQIRNYMITATTLTVVQGHRMHDVAIADLDLAATEKVNRAAGVSFKLPTSN